MTVNICGIPHKVIEVEDQFDAELHMGQIQFDKCEIHINKDLHIALKHETMCHEILHGMLMHLGYDELSEDEKFVQALGNAINQTFSVRYEQEEWENIFG